MSSPDSIEALVSMDYWYSALPLLAQYLVVPQHVAFVMDGNRRFARNRNENPSAGHQAGYGALRHILEFCYRAGVKEVSVYAFSIENFKRSSQEVDNLMNIAQERISQIIDQNDLAEEHGVRIKIVGDVSLLPEGLQKTCNEAEKLTKNNSSVRLNICMPYTARDDIAHSIRTLATKQKKDISGDDIEQNLYTSGSRPLDLLIRTSGTLRLSDYLLWEINDDTKVVFEDTLWPDYTPWQLLKSFISYNLDR